MCLAIPPMGSVKANQAETSLSALVFTYILWKDAEVLLNKNTNKRYLRLFT